MRSKKRKPIIQVERSVRSDGKVNVWSRYRGKYDFTAWVLIGVEEKGE